MGDILRSGRTMPALSGKTRVCALFGYPVEHSFSPAMHNAAFAAANLDYVYVAFPVPPKLLPAAVAAIKALDLAGVNVTVPHKEKVLPLLDRVAPGARLAGAVNTIVFRHGLLEGHNTDGAGFVRALAEEADFVPRGSSVLILGAGGAARAVAVHMALAGAAHITVANRTAARAAELAALLNKHTGARAGFLEWPGHFGTGGTAGEPAPAHGVGNRAALPVAPRSGGEATLDFCRAVKEADLIVQTTPVGMFPRVEDCPPFPFLCLRPGQVVADLVYNPPRTLFLARAAEAGARVCNGLGMLLYQGALAFELWTGRAAPLEVMRRALPGVG